MAEESKKEGKPLSKDLQARQELLAKGEISLILDTYDDIFSDFDPRPYSQRALSDDFLQEARRASRDKATGTVELVFMMPKDKRNPYDEALIRKRIREYFRKHHAITQNDIKSTIKRGINFVFAGIVVMLIATFILFKSNRSSFLSNFIVVLLEPAGWFLFWEGLDQSIFESKKKLPEIEFYHKMSKAEIKFNSY